jgi:hypothetical protein
MTHGKRAVAFLSSAALVVSTLAMTAAIARGYNGPGRSYSGPAYGYVEPGYAPLPYSYGSYRDDIDQNVPGYVRNHPNECYTDDGYGRFRACDSQ